MELLLVGLFILGLAHSARFAKSPPAPLSSPGSREPAARIVQYARTLSAGNVRTFYDGQVSLFNLDDAKPDIGSKIFLIVVPGSASSLESELLDGPKYFAVGSIHALDFGRTVATFESDEAIMIHAPVTRSETHSVDRKTIYKIRIDPDRTSASVEV